MLFVDGVGACNKGMSLCKDGCGACGGSLGGCGEVFAFAVMVLVTQ